MGITLGKGYFFCEEKRMRLSEVLWEISFWPEQLTLVERKEDSWLRLTL